MHLHLSNCADFMIDWKVDTRSFLLTGATGAIGKAIAMQLAKMPGSEVVLISRSQQKAEQTRKEITHSTGNLLAPYEFIQLDNNEDRYGYYAYQGPLIPGQIVILDQQKLHE